MNRILVRHVPDSASIVLCYENYPEFARIIDDMLRDGIIFSYLTDPVTKAVTILIPEDVDKDKLNLVFKPYVKFLDIDDSYRAFKKKAAKILLEADVIDTKIVCSNPRMLPIVKLREVLSYFVKAAVNTPAYKSKRWDGKICLLDRRSMKFPTGLLDVVVDLLRKEGFTCEVKYLYEQEVPRQFDWKAKELFEIADDQKEAISACLKAKRCVCKAPTGYGKTAVLARYLVAEHGVPTLFIANKKQLLDDAATDFANGIEGISDKDIGQIKDGKFCDSALSKGLVKPITQPIVVATIQSLAARLKDPLTRDVLIGWLHNTCKFVMVDETQAVGTKIWDTVLREIYAPYRVSLSATPKRTDGATIKIFAYAGPLVYETSAQEQIEKGRLCELSINYLPFDHRLYNYRDKNVEYADSYEEFIMRNTERNKHCIVEPAIRMTEEGRFVLILIQRIEHGDILKDLLIKSGMEPSDIRFIYGSSASEAREMAIREFRKGQFKILIGSTIFDAGVNIPLISGIILAGAGNSDITLIQRIGRGARTCDYEDILGYLPDFMKENPEKITKVYDVLDMHIKFFTKQARNRYETAKAEFGDERVHIVGGNEDCFSSRRPGKVEPVVFDNATNEQIAEAARIFAQFNQS